MRLSFAPLALTCALALASTGCIKKLILDGTIEGTRKASGALDTLGDYELARSATQAGLVQFEGMHKLAPDNDNALFLLTQSWTGYGFAFVEDEMEAAEDAGDDELADYHKKRAKMAYDRAVFYGLELLHHTSDSLDAARKNHDSMSKWLADKFTDADEVGNIFWTGYAWMARVSLMKGDPDVGAQYVADLDVGVGAWSSAPLALDPTYNNHSALVALAAYHSRMRSVSRERPGKKELFEKALQLARARRCWSS